MSWLVGLSWLALGSALAMAFLLGAAPVFVVRCIACIYPKGDPRRGELHAEMAWVQQNERVLEQWRRLGEYFGVALCEGLPKRQVVRRWTKRPRYVVRDYGHDYHIAEIRGTFGRTLYLHKEVLTAQGRTKAYYAKFPLEGDPTFSVEEA